MTDRPDTQPLQQEWLLLQAQHEHYELWTLAIKLTAVLLLAFAPVSTLLLLLAMLALLWLQDAIFKTFQARLGERLLQVERALREPASAAAMQFNSEWQAQRPGVGGLLAAYLRAACRPTVAFPYPLLMALAVLLA